uniref:Leucine--tRNA ligase n=1 Tax=Ananas comosus var. bracteatus TaxID=296719 RepID=A0A6V7NIB0_ANACO|nr:unnamed protein product [Ananas comosus var. bracteatus]
MAVLYSEPEKKVMSRSGDECVVALTDQWYITYGEAEWKEKAMECLEKMNTFSTETRNGFEHTLSWLNQWACSRSFGLGTRIPWDEQFLVESLSDSTLYMAYYTIAHVLQNGDMYGSNASSVRPEQMTDEVWDYIFCDGPVPKSEISPALLSKMKKEFEYCASPEALMARGFRCNGHLMLNSEKMSKSTGNFRTLRQAIEEFSSDATRFSLADAGDGMDDANFVFETANAAILRLTKEIAWMEEVLSVESALRAGSPLTYADRVFANEMNFAVVETEKSYNNFMFREALKTGFYDLQAARDEYRFSCGAGGMNKELLFRFMDVQTRLITPICPHYAEHVWKNILKNDGFIVRAGWPFAEPRIKRYESPTKQTDRRAYFRERAIRWLERRCLRILRSKFDDTTGSFAPDKEILEALKSSSIGNDANFKQIQKLCMPFIKFKKDETKEVGGRALDLKLPFGEIEVLKENIDVIKRQLGLEHVEVLCATDDSDRSKSGPHISLLTQNPPSPGNPVAIFLSKAEFSATGY